MAVAATFASFAAAPARAPVTQQPLLPYRTTARASAVYMLCLSATVWPSVHSVIDRYDGVVTPHSLYKSSGWADKMSRRAHATSRTAAVLHTTNRSRRSETDFTEVFGKFGSLKIADAIVRHPLVNGLEVVISAKKRHLRQFNRRKFK